VMPFSAAMALGAVVGGGTGIWLLPLGLVESVVALVGVCGAGVALALSGKPVGVAVRVPQNEVPADTMRSTDEEELSDMVLIPRGVYRMGSVEGEPKAYEDELPAHWVEVGPFWIGRFPVTQKAYREYRTEHRTPFDGDDLPVTMVSWYDAVRYCNWRSKNEGLLPAYQIGEGKEPLVEWIREADGYRLPTEAEWEYAARGTDGRWYPWGSEAPRDQLVWNGLGNDIGAGERSGPASTGSSSKKASPFGVQDMAGNVCEWCFDGPRSYEISTRARPIPNPVGPEGTKSRALRGGSWWDASPWVVRTAYRRNLLGGARESYVGFRCARGRLHKMTS